MAKRPKSDSRLRTSCKSAFDIAEIAPDRGDKTAVLGAVAKRKPAASLRSLPPAAVLGMAIAFAVGLGA